MTAWWQQKWCHHFSSFFFLLFLFSFLKVAICIALCFLTVGDIRFMPLNCWFHGMKLEFHMLETKVSYAWNSSFFGAKLKFQARKLTWNLLLKEEEEVTTEMLSPCCHMLLSHHYLFTIKDLNVKMWQVTAKFHFLIL